jgi:hypothetical protein
MDNPFKRVWRNIFGQEFFVLGYGNHSLHVADANMSVRGKDKT